MFDLAPRKGRSMSAGLYLSLGDEMLGDEGRDRVPGERGESAGRKDAGVFTVNCGRTSVYEADR